MNRTITIEHDGTAPPELRVRPQQTPFRARQVARFIAIAFCAANMLEDRRDQNRALSADHRPSLHVSTPDGRQFRISVEEI